MGDFETLLKNKKSKHHISQNFNKETFINDLIEYMTKLVENNKPLSIDIINNFHLYLSYFEQDINLDKLHYLKTRCNQLKRSRTTEKNILEYLISKIDETLGEKRFDEQDKHNEQKRLGKIIDEILEDNNPIIFDLLNRSDISKFKYHDGQLLIDKVYNKFERLLQEKDLYIESLNYLKQVIFKILSQNRHGKKIDQIIQKLNALKGKLNNKEQQVILKNLKDELTILKTDKLSEGHISLLMEQYGIPKTFSYEALEEANNLTSCRTEPPSWFDNHKRINDNIIDYRDKKIITIDQHFKAAYDDAISLEKTEYGYLLGIYITDVCSYIDINSSLGACAKERCESIYLSESNQGTITMFPEEITRNLFSLNQGQDKQVIAYMFKFSNNYDLIGHEFHNAIINVRSNYSYDDIKKFKSHDPNYDMIYGLIKISEHLNQNYNQGYHHLKEKVKNTNHGYEIISTLSIYLNSTIATLFNSKNYPLIYRVNESIISDTNYDIESLVKNYQKSFYSAFPTNHVMTGGPYCNITNPIRNYPSFVNQYLFCSLFLDWWHSGEQNKFIEYWHNVLPDLTSKINATLDNNEAFRNIMKTLKK